MVEKRKAYRDLGVKKESVKKIISYEKDMQFVFVKTLISISALQKAAGTISVFSASKSLRCVVAE